MNAEEPITLPTPELQVDFSLQLERIRALYLQTALSKTVEEMDVPTIDRELADYVPTSCLSMLARNGLRGELVFAVPSVLQQNPFLLAYYRLLLGYSRKDLYETDSRAKSFKSMEERGALTVANASLLPELCRALSASAAALVEGIGAERLSASLLDDLTLLTLGPQLRGGANVKKGRQGIEAVFRLIHEIVKGHAVSTTSTRIELRNSAGRKVLIEFAPDPDIIIREELAPKDYRNIIAVEVKGGTDYSNVHNRIGEAEKSHQKARQAGYVECWTVLNVRRFNLEMAHRESPSTNRFYSLKQLGPQGTEFHDFCNRIRSLTGLPATTQL